MFPNLRLGDLIMYVSLNSVSEGQFSNEYALSVRNFEGDLTSGFFEKKYVKDNKLVVKVLSDVRKNTILIEVPGQFINGEEATGSGRYINVKRSDLFIEKSNKEFVDLDEYFSAA